ncbi:hypothetical protein NADFUDRAFT_84601 [Nadsonia fulvescens var. elongata DSM 6958]|uniref:Zn(2)-C6 fungal-type domain-containing protein n=1 Tax=Nadsonia fulvescens var. elongata DSM 6958 TaxID=857566 RepID=A0A1E3PD33_9ASCO|nr:hypothetical protein NADFUDRAFT_84601 [Nadsonia fulvescens var. elongata DSM 6958]
MSDGSSKSISYPVSVTASPDSSASVSASATFSSRPLFSASSPEVPSPQSEKIITRSDKSKKLRRKKISRACVHCQKSHVTCDEGRPCQRCIKRGLASTCRDAERKPAKYLRQDATLSSVDAGLRAKKEFENGRKNYSLNIFNSKPLSSSIHGASDVHGPVLLNQAQPELRNSLRVVLTGPGGYQSSRPNSQAHTGDINKGSQNSEVFSGMLTDISQVPHQHQHQHQHQQQHQQPHQYHQYSQHLDHMHQQANTNSSTSLTMESPSIFPEVYMSNHDFGSKTANLEYSILSNMLKDTYGSPLDSNASPMSQNGLNAVSPLTISNAYRHATSRQQHQQQLDSLNPSELTTSLQQGDDHVNGTNTITNLAMSGFQLVGPRTMQDDNTLFNYENNHNSSNQSTPSTVHSHNNTTPSLLNMNDSRNGINNNNNISMGAPSTTNLNLPMENIHASSRLIETLPALNILSGDDEDITHTESLASTSISSDGAKFGTGESHENQDPAIPSNGGKTSSIFKNPREVYVSVTEPFSYTQGYHVLIAYLRSRFNRSQLIQVARSMVAYRPSFTATTKTLMEEDLIFMEKCFQRTLLEFEKIIPISGTPTIIWRRTGQIAAVGKEFCLLTGWDKSSLLDNNRFIVELMDDNSVLQYFDVFSTLAFGDSRGVTMTDCTLLKPNGEKVPTACTWTVKRDVFDIPMMVIGNFLPIL